MSFDNVISSGDIIQSVKANQPGGGRSSQEPSKVIKFAAQQAIDSIQDSTSRKMVQQLIEKEVQSPDLSNIRLVSFAPRFAELRNEMTVLYNILEANEIARVTDFQTKFFERRIGFDLANPFNPNGALPGEAQSNTPARTNTLGFIGNQLKIRFIAEELALQSPVNSLSEKARQIDDELVRIRRGINARLLVNTEQTSEAPASIPAPGGFITRSTSYNTVVAGDLTNNIIQSNVRAIANLASAEGYGYSQLVCLLGGDSQLSVVRDLMINRYPGQNWLANDAMCADLARRLANVDVPTDQMMGYQPNPGRPVLFCYEPQMPTDTAFFFDPMQPQLAKFQMMGSMGPWALERPTPELLYLYVVFDAWTLQDHLIPSRSVVRGLNP